MAKETAAENKRLIENLIRRARRNGFFLVGTRNFTPVSKCANGCGMSVITFRNAKEEERLRCFRCGK